MAAEETNLAIYKAYLDDLGRIGSHHTQTRAFYVSVISALLVLIAAIAANSKGIALTTLGEIAVSILGVILCISWYNHILLFDRLYEVKFEILREMESKFEFAYGPFLSERIKLFGDNNERKDYSAFTKLEYRVIPFVGFLFGALLLASVYNTVHPPLDKKDSICKCCCQTGNETK